MRLRRPRSRTIGWVAGLVVLAGIGGYLLVGANRPADPHLGPSRRTPVPGFGQIAFRVDTATSTRRCALLADTEARRDQGLMNRTDLAGYDGMLFSFAADTTVQFYMKDTLLPLSIAWFDARGRFVSSTDMEPCLDSAECPTFAAARAYRYALEVGKGGLAALGIGPGSHLSVGGACT